MRTIAACVSLLACSIALASPPAAAAAQQREVSIPAGDLAAALNSYVRQTGRQLIYRADEVRGVRSPGTRGARPAGNALDAILRGTGFSARTDPSGAIAITRGAARSAPAALSSQDGAAPSAATFGADANASSQEAGEGARESATTDAEAADPIVVTGSRIVSNVGMKAPTPVTAVGAEELEALSPTTLISAISQLPQFYGNTSNDVRSGFFSSPGSGNLNLRGLNTGGSGRTLTLLDGRRVVPATGFGSVDINILPQALISRVETVTGGASAAYGTDAVAGAVNFILNTNYTGWQASVQAGTTDEGDHDNFQVSGAFGTKLGDRAHLLISADYYHAERVLGFPRDWYEGWSLINRPAATAANPNETRYLRLPNVVSSIATFGGLINSGVPTTSALYRRYFRPDGTLAPFVLGTGTATSAHSIANGGSGDDATYSMGVLAPEAQRASGFVYLDFDATPSLNLYVQGLVGQSLIDQPDHGGRFANVAGIDTRLTIFRENAFLPAAVRQIMVNEGLTSFQMNVVGDRRGLGRETRMQQDNLTYSGTAGFKYEVPEGLLRGWRIDGYAQYGTADNTGYQQGVLLDRIAAAVDAVVDPATGQTVCRAALVNLTVCPLAYSSGWKNSGEVISCPGVNLVT